MGMHLVVRAHVPRRRVRAAVTVLAAGASLAAAAQTPAAAPGSAASAPSAEQLQPVQITGSRPDDVQERRQSTAAKIIFGREEIDRYGDTTLGDVLKRLPGVTIQGRPGRGGAIRMRGLGGGYTQILIDGERVSPGFSFDSLSPEQVERIEILRAPTAETGARAIAGTINIITRESYTKRVNDVRISAGFENGNIQPSLSWTRNVAADPFTINYSLTAYAVDRDNSSTTTTEAHRLDDGSLTLAQRDEGRARARGGGLHGNARVQWRSSDGADVVVLTPILVHNQFRNRREGTLTQTTGSAPAPYDSSQTEGDSASTFARLNSQWNRRLASGGRLESRVGFGGSRTRSHSLRTETTGGVPSRTLEDDIDSRDTSLLASGKLIQSAFGQHSLVAGIEGEQNRREDTSVTLQNGLPLLAEFGDELSASTTRFAAYLQDEWNLTPQWAAHAGLRWEGITTRGTVAPDEPVAKNRSSVWTPLLHTVWKPDPASRDQLRISLTRSYKSPPLANLIARPRVNTRYPVPGPNTPTQPDRAGNPELRPELATGIDVAIERYLAGSGLVSANVFARRIKDYQRSVTTLEDVSYSTTPRYVLRPQNVGSALTQGIELEAKFRASDVFAGAPRLDVRANASFFRSRVDGVPGPDNRLDQQPDYTANLGLDYRFAGLPLTIGGNLNWTPGYDTRLSDIQSASIGQKLVADVYALWVFGPAVALRITASNLAAQDYRFSGTVDGPDIAGIPVRETSTTTQPTFVNVQLRLELKL